MPTVTFNPDGRTVDVARRREPAASSAVGRHRRARVVRRRRHVRQVPHGGRGGRGHVRCPRTGSASSRRPTGGSSAARPPFTATSLCASPMSPALGSVPVAGGTRRPVNPVLSQQERIARLPRHTSPPPVAKRLLRMMPPDGTDNVNDAGARQARACDAPTASRTRPSRCRRSASFRALSARATGR